MRTPAAQAKRAVLTTAGFGAPSRRAPHGQRVPPHVSRFIAPSGVFMAVYTASLQQLERVRNGKRGLVRPSRPGALHSAR